MTTDTTPSSTLVPALEKLRDRLIDAIHGYDEALKHAEPEVAPVLGRMKSTHEAHVASLGLALARMNGDTSDDGSWMTPVQEAVMKARAWLTGIDEGVLPAVARGERSLLELYDDAIAGARSSPDLLATLQRQREVLAVQVETIEASKA